MSSSEGKSGEIDGRVRPLPLTFKHTVHFNPVHGHKLNGAIRVCLQTLPVLDGSCCLLEGNEPQNPRVSAEQRPQTAAKLE